MDGVSICLSLTVVAIAGVIFAKMMVLHMIRDERAARHRGSQDDRTVGAEPESKRAGE